MAPQVRTPLFILNAAYDSWQVSTHLVLRKQLLSIEQKVGLSFMLLSTVKWSPYPLCGEGGLNTGKIHVFLCNTRLFLRDEIH